MDFLLQKIGNNLGRNHSPNAYQKTYRTPNNNYQANSEHHQNNYSERQNTNQTHTNRPNNYQPKSYPSNTQNHSQQPRNRSPNVPHHNARFNNQYQNRQESPENPHYNEQYQQNPNNYRQNNNNYRGQTDQQFKPQYNQRPPKFQHQEQRQYPPKNQYNSQQSQSNSYQQQPNPRYRKPPMQESQDHYGQSRYSPPPTSNYNNKSHQPKYQEMPPQQRPNPSNHMKNMQNNPAGSNNYNQQMRNFPPPPPRVRGRGRGRGRGRQGQFQPEQPEDETRAQKFFSQNQKRDFPPKAKAKHVIEQQIKPQMFSGQQNENSQIEQIQEDDSVQQEDSAEQEQASGSYESPEKQQDSSSQNEEQEESNKDSENNAQSQRHEESQSVILKKPILLKGQQANYTLQHIDVMCSKEEFNQRLQTFNMNNKGDQNNFRLDTGRSFAIFQINKKTGKPDYALTLKRYRRSTNRFEENQDGGEEIDLPRSKKGLILSMKHVHTYIIDADNIKPKDLAFPLPPSQDRLQFLHIFDFLWNRMREMIKDVSRLDLNQKKSKDIIQLCEQMLRFFVIAIRQGQLPHKSRLEFDPKMNIESIIKTLSQLLEIYQYNQQQIQRSSQTKSSIKDIYISPNEPEIISYAIIISNDIQNSLNEKLMIKLNGEGLAHPLLSTKEVQTALIIQKAMKNRDYQTYYQILEDPNTDYTFSCLLLLLLPQVRQETLKVMHKMSETEPISKVKRIPEISFRHALRFKSTQHREFQQFLIQIRATISNESDQSFILMSPIDDRVSAENHSILSYHFQTNKRLRSNYSIKPCEKKLKHPEEISREQLSKKSWFKGNYTSRILKYYRKEQAGQELQAQLQEQSQSESVQQRKKVIKTYNVIENKKKDDKIGDSQADKVMPSPKIIVQGQDKRNNLMQKRKQLQRKKALKTLQGLVHTLIKNSDIHSQHKRKKAVYSILNYIQYMKLQVLSASFTRVLQYVKNCKIVEASIVQIERYREIKEDFFKTVNKSPYQFENYLDKDPSRPQNVKMSDILKPNRKKIKKTQNLLHQIFSFYRQNLQQETKRLSVMYIFTEDPKRDFNQAQRIFLFKLYKYLTEGIQRTQYSIDEEFQQFLLQKQEKSSIEFKKHIYEDISERTDSLYQKIGLDYKITFLKYRYGQKNLAQPFLSGYDGLIFIDLWNNTKPFFKLLKDIKQKKRDIYQNCNQNPLVESLNYQIHILHITSYLSDLKESSQKDRQTQEKISFKESFHILQQENAFISINFKYNLLKFINSVRQKTKLYLESSFVILTVPMLIDLLQRNLLCIPLHEMKDQGVSIHFLELYFNQCLDCILKEMYEVCQSYEYYEWETVLQEAYHVAQGPKKYLGFKVNDDDLIINQQNFNFHECLYNKLYFSSLLIKELKLQITTNYKLYRQDMPESQGIFILSHVIDEYFKNVDKDNPLKEIGCITSIVLENNTTLDYGKDYIKGDARFLFTFIMNQLKKKLKYINVILTSNFQYKLNKKSFMKEDEKPQTKLLNVKDLGLKKTKVQPVERFVYQRQKLLKRLIQQIQEEQTRQPKKEEPFRLKYKANKKIELI